MKENYATWSEHNWGNYFGECIQRYAKFCDATGKTGTEYVMQAATFFGPDKHYENDWTIPATKVTVPKDDQEAIKWGQERGIEPKLGEPMYEYRRRLEGAL